MATTSGLTVEIWSDVICPWCYIGKRHFEAGLAGFEPKDKVDVRWRSFELDPSAQRSGDDLVTRLAKKYGVSRERALAMNQRVTDVAAEVGLDYRLDIARPGNTFDAHRVLHLAGEHQLRDSLEERFFRAYFVEGESIGNAATIVRLATEAGLAETAIREVLDGNGNADAVRADEAEAARLGITGVPFFVVDRQYGISGAQPPELILETLRRAWSEAHPLVAVAGPGDSVTCTDDSCGI